MNNSRDTKRQETHTVDNCMNEYSELTKDELIDHIEALESQLADPQDGYSRRSILTAAAGIAGLGAIGIYSVDAASVAPTGTFPAPSDDPLLKIRTDRVRFVGRTSDPSSPDNGTMWYRSDL